MPIVFEEPPANPSLRFTFDDDWQVIKLDDHRCFTERLMPLQLTRAVDFLGIYRKRGLYLIEVKDYRGSRIELKNEEKMFEGDTLFQQIGRKVKDSIACIIGAARRESEEFWTECANIIRERHLTIKTVFWLEFDLPRAAEFALLSSNYSRWKPISDSTS